MTDRGRFGYQGPEDDAFDRIIRAVLTGVIVGVPLLFLGFTNDPFSLPKLALLLGGVGTAAGLTVTRWAKSGAWEGARLLVLPATAVVVPLAVAWLGSSHKGWALLGSYTRYTGLAPYAAAALLGLLSVRAFWGRADRLAWALSLSGGVVGTYVFVQALGLDPLWSPGGPGNSPYPPSTIGHFNFVGGFLAIALPLSVYLWARSRSWGGRMAAIWATIAGALGLVLANSQGGWAAALAGLSIIMGSLLMHRWTRITGMVAAAAVAFLVVGAVIASLYVSDVGVLGGTTRSRGLLWVSALEMGAESPLIGHGPAAFSLEGVQYRSLDSVLAEKDTKADEPHSVPLSFWANAGALGATGFLVLVVWVIVVGARLSPDDHRSAAFLAAAVAYLVQSSVSIDHLPLQTALWASLAGLVISRGASTEASSERLPPPLARNGRGPYRFAVSVPAGILIGGAALWFAGGLVLADHRALTGRHRFEAGQLSEGRTALRKATGFRFEPRYLDLFGHHIGTAGLSRGKPGAPLIEEMRSIYGYLEGFPETYGLLAEARTLHHWALFESTADREALSLLQKARSLDPANPEIDIRISEALLGLGDADQAREVLEHWAPSLRGHLPGFWGALSTARLMAGDPVAAESALEIALGLDPHTCRVRTAGALLDRYRQPEKDLDLAEGLTIQIVCGRGEYLHFVDLMTEVRSQERP